MKRLLVNIFAIGALVFLYGCYSEIDHEHCSNVEYDKWPCSTILEEINEEDRKRVIP